MVREVEGSVVVVTGASSGIGRATALELASRGANVVVAARRQAPLEELARECTRYGPRAFAIPTDVTDEAAVDRLAGRTWNAFSGLDAWVNAAAVAAFARLHETPTDVFRRLLHTNVLGTAFGARAAHHYFRKQGGGVLVNVASILGKIAVPYLTAYNASKGGVVSLSESLRQELRPDGVHVCTVLPPPTDTPFYQHAADYTGCRVRPPFPVYRAETVARTIADCVERPRREVVVGVAAKLMRFAEAVAPRVYDRLAPPYIEKTMFENETKPPTAGNVFEPVVQGTNVSGGWKPPRARGRLRRRRSHTRLPRRWRVPRP